MILKDSTLDHLVGGVSFVFTEFFWKDDGWMCVLSDGLVWEEEICLVHHSIFHLRICIVEDGNLGLLIIGDLFHLDSRQEEDSWYCRITASIGGCWFIHCISAIDFGSV